MSTRLTARQTARLCLLAPFVVSAVAASAAEPMSNSSLSDAYVTEAAPPATCKTPQAAPAGQAPSSRSPCVAATSNAPVINPAQDAVVRQALAQDTVHTVPQDNGTQQGNPQLLQNLQGILYGYSSPSSQGGVNYNSYGGGPVGRGH